MDITAVVTGTEYDRMYADGIYIFCVSYIFTKSDGGYRPPLYAKYNTPALA